MNDPITSNKKTHDSCSHYLYSLKRFGCSSSDNADALLDQLPNGWNRGFSRLNGTWIGYAFLHSECMADATRFIFGFISTTNERDILVAVRHPVITREDMDFGTVANVTNTSAGPEKATAQAWQLFHEGAWSVFFLLGDGRKWLAENRIKENLHMYLNTEDAKPICLQIDVLVLRSYTDAMRDRFGW